MAEKDWGNWFKNLVAPDVTFGRPSGALGRQLLGAPPIALPEANVAPPPGLGQALEWGRQLWGKPPAWMAEGAAAPPPNPAEAFRASVKAQPAQATPAVKAAPTAQAAKVAAPAAQTGAPAAAPKAQTGQAAAPAAGKAPTLAEAAQAAAAAPAPVLTPGTINPVVAQQFRDLGPTGLGGGGGIGVYGQAPRAAAHEAQAATAGAQGAAPEGAPRATTMDRGPGTRPESVGGSGGGLEETLLDMLRYPSQGPSELTGGDVAHYQVGIANALANLQAARAGVPAHEAQARAAEAQAKAQLEEVLHPKEVKLLEYEAAHPNEARYAAARRGMTPESMTLLPPPTYTTEQARLNPEQVIAQSPLVAKVWADPKATWRQKLSSLHSLPGTEDPNNPMHHAALTLIRNAFQNPETRAAIQAEAGINRLDLAQIMGYQPTSRHLAAMNESLRPFNMQVPREFEP
jgi:hypothetical protein